MKRFQMSRLVGTKIVLRRSSWAAARGTCWGLPASLLLVAPITRSARSILFSRRKALTAAVCHFSSRAVFKNERMEYLGLTNQVVLPRHPPQRKVRVRYQHPTTIVPVTAIHMAQEIDLEAVQSIFLPSDQIQRFGKTSIVVRLASDEEDQHPGDDKSYIDRYVAVYRFGSIIFFNMNGDDDDARTAELVRQVQQHARQPALYGFERTETFAVHVSPDHPAVVYDRYRNGASSSFVAREENKLNNSNNNNERRILLHDDDNNHHVRHRASPVVTADYCIVPELDNTGVAVISNILAQSVALENYDDLMETLIRNFERINQTVTQKGHFDPRLVDVLFQTVSQNNCIYLDMVSKIRVKDRADTAWDFVKYETIHYGLKEEFEIDERFENIEFKLNLIQENSEFFLQVLQEENASTVEWIIISLICLEGVLMIVEMSGLGQAFFQSWLLVDSSIVAARA